MTDDFTNTHNGRLDLIITSMFGKNQKMDILNPTEEAINLLKALMGSSGVARKEFVFNEIDFSTVRE